MSGLIISSFKKSIAPEQTHIYLPANQLIDQLKALYSDYLIRRI
jgi:hypothetical protein